MSASAVFPFAVSLFVAALPFWHHARSCPFPTFRFAALARAPFRQLIMFSVSGGRAKIRAVREAANGPVQTGKQRHISAVCEARTPSQNHKTHLNNSAQSNAQDYKTVNNTQMKLNPYTSNISVRVYYHFNNLRFKQSENLNDFLAAHM